MSRNMRAVVTEWHGSTGICIDTNVAVTLIQEILGVGISDETQPDWELNDDGDYATLTMRESAADRFLALLEGDEDTMWAVITDALVRISAALAETDGPDIPEPDNEDLAIQVGRWRDNASEWRAAIDDGELVLKLDYN